MTNDSNDFENIYGVYRDGDAFLTVAPSSIEGQVCWTVATIEDCVSGVSSAAHIDSIIVARGMAFVEHLCDEEAHDTRTLAELNID